jgi:hypothetical protein
MLSDSIPSRSASSIAVEVILSRLSGVGALVGRRTVGVLRLGMGGV